MRTIKTTVAVMLSLAIFLPLEALGTAEGTRFIDQLGPFYACIASIVCMQSSVGATWKQGGSRLLGTLIGGLLGLLCVSVTTYWGHPVVLVLVCVSPLVQNLARWLMRLLPKTEKWQQRRADWQQQLDVLGEESRRLLADKPRCAEILALQAVKLFGLFCLPYLCIRFLSLIHI